MAKDDAGPEGRWPGTINRPTQVVCCAGVICPGTPLCRLELAEEGTWLDQPLH